jgi:hypothetical protein
MCSLIVASSTACASSQQTDGTVLDTQSLFTITTTTLSSPLTTTLATTSSISSTAPKPQAQAQVPVTKPPTTKAPKPSAPVTLVDNGFIGLNGKRYWGSKWGQDIELSVPCGVLNTGVVRFLLLLSDGRKLEKKSFVKGDSNTDHASRRLDWMGEISFPYPLYLHTGAQNIDLRCGFDRGPIIE